MIQTHFGSLHFGNYWGHRHKIPTMFKYHSIAEHVQYDVQ